MTKTRSISLVEHNREMADLAMTNARQKRSMDELGERIKVLERDNAGLEQRLDNVRDALEDYIHAYRTLRELVAMKKAKP